MSEKDPALYKKRNNLAESNLSVLHAICRKRLSYLFFAQLIQCSSVNPFIRKKVYSQYVHLKSAVLLKSTGYNEGVIFKIFEGCFPLLISFSVLINISQLKHLLEGYHQMCSIPGSKIMRKTYCLHMVSHVCYYISKT